MKYLILSLILLCLDASAEKIVFIVNSANPVTEMAHQDIVDYYLKKRRQWPDGKQVRFLDRADKAESRESFLGLIKRSAREVDLYWIGQKLYTGDSAPQQIGSDSMAATMVARFPEAISYVSESFAKSLSNSRVKVLRTY